MMSQDSAQIIMKQNESENQMMYHFCFVLWLSQLEVFFHRFQPSFITFTNPINGIAIAFAFFFIAFVLFRCFLFMVRCFLKNFWRFQMYAISLQY